MDECVWLYSTKLVYKTQWAGQVWLWLCLLLPGLGDPQAPLMVPLAPVALPH